MHHFNCWRSVPLPCGQYMAIFITNRVVNDIINTVVTIFIHCTATSDAYDDIEISILFVNTISIKIASKPSSNVLRLPELPIMQKSETQNLWMQSICTFLCLDSTYSPSHKNASTWGLRCAIFWCPGAAGAVGGGKQENTWRTGAHSLPQLCTLNTSGGEDHKRFLQIEAVRAGVLVAADVWLACTHHHLPHTQPPAECSQPKCHKMQKNKDVKI